VSGPRVRSYWLRQSQTGLTIGCFTGKIHNSNRLLEDHPAIQQFGQQIGTPLAGPEFEIGAFPIRVDFDDQTARRIVCFDFFDHAKMAPIERVSYAENRRKAAYGPFRTGAQGAQLRGIELSALLAMAAGGERDNFDFDGIEAQ